MYDYTYILLEVAWCAQIGVENSGTANGTGINKEGNKYIMNTLCSITTSIIQ